MPSKYAAAERSIARAIVRLRDPLSSMTRTPEAPVERDCPGCGADTIGNDPHAPGCPHDTDAWLAELDAALPVPA